MTIPEEMPAEEIELNDAEMEALDSAWEQISTSADFAWDPEKNPKDARGRWARKGEKTPAPATPAPAAPAPVSARDRDKAIAVLQERHGVNRDAAMLLEMAQREVGADPEKIMALARGAARLNGKNSPGAEEVLEGAGYRDLHRAVAEMGSAGATRLRRVLAAADITPPADLRFPHQETVAEYTARQLRGWPGQTSMGDEFMARVHRSDHREAVREALADGLQVESHILSEHPELKSHSTR